MKKYLLILLAMTTSSYGAIKEYNWKFEGTYAPQYYMHSQSGFNGKVKGNSLIFKNFQMNARRRFKSVHLDIDYRQSNFDFKTEEQKGSVQMRDLSAGITYKNFVLRYESTVAPYVSSDPETEALDLTGSWINLSYRYQFKNSSWRIGGGYSHLLSLDLQKTNVSDPSGSKFTAWVEYWYRIRIRKIEGLILSIRFFGEDRNYEFGSKDWDQKTKLHTTQIGTHVGLAKLF